MKLLFLSLLAVTFCLIPNVRPASLARASGGVTCCPQYAAAGWASRRAPRRYPMLHGIYYSRPLNYRNLFDYPWHARLVRSVPSYPTVVSKSWQVPTSSRLHPVGDALAAPHDVK